MDESKLHCGRETRFGQATNCGIHCSNGRGNLAFYHCGGIKIEWEALNLQGFLKIECCKKNELYPLPFMKEILDMVHVSQS
jgi:hypothetical protein